LCEIISTRIASSEGAVRNFYEGVLITLEASCRFFKRYGSLASEMAENENNCSIRENLLRISVTCNNLAVRPPSGFREALQSAWMLFVILHMESNASSFSPGRMDQYLFPYFDADIKGGIITADKAQELTDALFIKFNQIVYLRNSHSARYFAGFPIGFNVTLGGRDKNGSDSVNDLTYIFLKAQDHCRMPQPNLTARLHRNSPEKFIHECCRIIGLGTGMPQIANDESIIPSLIHAGIDEDDSCNYVLVGCVELSTGGNYLGWSDAAMFNMVKVLELTLNDGKCMITGEQSGLRTGILNDYGSFGEFEEAFGRQIKYFISVMTALCETVEECHQQRLPTPFLSSVTGDCILKGIDVTAGGAKYNYSGIQAIQAANIADSLAVLKKLLFSEDGIDKDGFHKILLNNFAGEEPLRQYCINRIAKYGNDVAEVDDEARKWIEYFYKGLSGYRNYRGGRYQMGLYTVSAHVPMGANVGATPDGRLSGTPLADGGLSAMYGRDKNGPTALLNSVARIPSLLASNGTLLNMKFLPGFFNNENELTRFESLIKSFVNLPVHHVQFNVISNKDLLRAKNDPESYRDLTVRVAGYTAFFTELSGDLQDEIISRTTHG
jgi:formate C-acetyltransferase